MRATPGDFAVRSAPAKERGQSQELAVGGEKGPGSGVGVVVEVGLGGQFGIAAEHDPVERGRHDQPVELLGGQPRVLEPQRPAGGEAFNDGGQRVDGASGAAKASPYSMRARGKNSTTNSQS